MSRPGEEETIGPSSRTLYIDDTASQNSLLVPASEPLLKDDALSSIGDLQKHKKPKRTTLISSSNSSTARRKPSRASNDTGVKRMLGRRKGSRICLTVGLGIFVLLGVIQLLNLIGSLVVLILPSEIHQIVKSWGRPGRIGAGLSSWPTDFSQDVLPIPCHSHNDYWRTVPLFSAIEAGCTGVEADIWLFDEELFVGHSVASLARNRTLNSLYINPLLEILSKQNPKHTLLREDASQPHGVFDTNPEQTLVLLIDFKTSGSALWPHVQSAIEPLRAKNYLSRSNGTQLILGPITVVGTGNTPFSLVSSENTNPYHDVFFDAPLKEMYEGLNAESLPNAAHPAQILPENSIAGDAVPDGVTTTRGTPKVSGSAQVKRSDEGGQGDPRIAVNDVDAYTVGNSFYASVSFGSAIGQLWNGEFSERQMDLLRGQIGGAHKRGLKARYWELPFWPIGLRNHVWDVLVKEGVDMLNVDDLTGATKRDWRKHRRWWKPVKGASYDVYGDNQQLR